MSKRPLPPPIGIRKVKMAIRQLLSKLSSLENSIIFHPSTGGSASSSHSTSSNSSHSTSSNKSLNSTEKSSNSLGGGGGRENIEWSKYCQVSGPTLKHLKNLFDYFDNEILDRIWGCASVCGWAFTPSHAAINVAKAIGNKKKNDQNSKIIVPDTPPLLDLLAISSFSMGRLAMEFEESEFEDFYNLMPEHTWRWILFQHLCCLVMQHIAIDQLLPRFADMCIEKGAFYQAFEMLKYFWCVAQPTTKEEYKWASKKASNIHMSQAWIQFLAEYIVTYDLGSEFYFGLVDDTLLKSGVEIASIIINEYHDIDYNRTLLAVDFLIDHCCKNNHINTDPNVCPCFSLLSKATERISDVSILQEKHLDHNLLFSLYFSVCSNMENQSILESASTIINNVDLSICIPSFTPLQIFNVAIKAKSRNLWELCSTLLVFAINSIKQSQRKNSSLNQEEEGFIKEMESHLIESQEASKAPKSWRYEIIADIWVANTPKPNPRNIDSVPGVISHSSRLPTPISQPKTPFRKPMSISNLRSIADDDPLTAIMSVERIRRVIHEKKRNGPLTSSTTTPRSIHSTLSHDQSASPMHSLESPAFRPFIPSQMKQLLSIPRTRNPRPSVFADSSDGMKHSSLKKRRFAQDTSDIENMPPVHPRIRLVSQLNSHQSSDPLMNVANSRKPPPIPKSLPPSSNLGESEIDDLLC